MIYDPAYTYKFQLKTTQGLLYVADILEEIYTNKDFPDLSNNNHQVPSLSVSMQESGKSRADLWAFATLIAAQMGVEQNNLACQGKTSSKNQFVTNLKIRKKCILKVSKFQKQIFMFSFESKTERNYFLISVLGI